LVLTSYEHEHDSAAGWSILQIQVTMATPGLVRTVVESMESQQVSRMMGQVREPTHTLADAQ
jgi:hypothetical protein